MSASIRRATAGDIATLAGLHALCFSQSWDETSLAGLLAAQGNFTLMDGDASGFVMVRVAADEAEILTICVAPKRRRHGIGKALLGAAGAAAFAAGASAMFLEVITDNFPAKSLYESHGFRAVGMRKAYYEGSDALVLKAELPLVGKSAKTV